MDAICSLQPRSVTTIPTSLSSLSKHGFSFKASESDQFLAFPSLIKYPNAGKFKFLHLRAPASGRIKASSSKPVEANPKKLDSKDKDLVFVAGATGKVGSRTVRELLKLGFRVRAGVRSAQRAEILVQSVKQMKLENMDERIQPVEKLEIVECDLEKRDRILPALGNASVVICCIGASEKEISDITGPYRIDFQATKNLIDAATVAKVNHFILLTSLGTNKIGFPAAILNLFWGVLIWKRKAEEALIASGLPYTIVRPGGMERPTDAYKQTHNITFSEEDTLFGGQVSNLQVAELLACMAKNPELSYCKVVEVIAETTAPLKPMEELLAKIPSKRPYTPPQMEPVATPEPDPAPSVSVAKELQTPTEEVAKQEKSMEIPKQEKPVEVPKQEKPVEAMPLSPYAAYKDLKPPTSPTPTVSTSFRSTKATDAGAAPVELKSTPPQALPKAPIQDEPKEEEKKTRPLSPFASYNDLKPPTSPTPTPSTSNSEINTLESSSIPSDSATETSTKIKTSFAETTPAPERKRPLSPYAVYEDLKPPTSPSATASGPKEDVSQVIGGNDVPKTTTVAGVVEDPSRNNSPYYGYEDLKPPTSAPPNSPKASIVSESPINEATISSGNNTTESPSPSRAQQNQAGSKPQPLSPYTMYEDLKPPTSPVPSAGKNY